MLQAMVVNELDLYEPIPKGAPHETRSRRNIIWKVHEKFEVIFEEARDVYSRLLRIVLDHRRGISIVALSILFIASKCVPHSVLSARTSFPSVDCRPDAPPCPRTSRNKAGGDWPPL